MVEVFLRQQQAFKFPAKRLDTNKVIKTLGVDNKYHTRMTGQMPSVLKLNNGNAVIAAESVYRETASGKDKFKISFAFNKDEFFPHVPLGVAGSDAVKCNGSCSMRLYSFNVPLLILDNFEVVRLLLVIMKVERIKFDLVVVH